MKKNFSYNSILKKASVPRIANRIIIIIIFLLSSFLIQNFNNIKEIDRDFNDFSQTPLLADADSVLFEGNEISLNITDYGNLYKYDQEVSLSSQDPTNVTYFLDDVHDWKSSEINFTIQDIHDTREWVSDADFYDIEAPFRTYISESNDDPSGFPTHNYSADLSPTYFHTTISETGAIAMRLYFSRIEIETDWDLLFIYDGDDTLQYLFTGKETNFYTPWIRADTLKLSIDSDGTIEWYGYDVNYYEFYNSSSTSYSQFESSWGYNTNSLSNNFGPGNISESSAMHVSLMSDPSRDTSSPYGLRATYYGNDHVEIYQNITIPRGEVIDGYISFDYYAESVIASNEFYIYCAIDNQIVYNKGFRNIVEYEGRGIWHDTGNIYMPLWNNKEVFQNIQVNQNVNISIGIMSGASVTYSGFEDLFQQNFWFDNVSLVLTTLANSTQDGINLTIDGNYPIDDSSWGRSSLSLNNLWVLNPISIEFTTTSPSLSFNLNTSIFGYRETTSKIDQLNNEGLNYYILENGTIYWEFYHNFYMPSQYSDFEFIISKPKNWEFISALDPTLQSRVFEDGAMGDSDLKINKSNALFPGWWSFKATSPNYLNISNTKMYKQGEWTQPSFNTGESTIIKTQVNHSNEVPINLGSTEVNLTVYDPEGGVWFSETQTPLSNGSVFFSELYFDALNTTGGQYDYTLFWSNGTSLGGLNSSFLVIHQSSFSLSKPNDAISDSITDAFIGDVIPVRVNLKDSENNDSISNALISYNWTSGSLYFEEAALGIYETILDTSDLVSNGFYEILIESSKEGFLDYNLTLKINLGEETNVQRLQSDYNIELHANSTIKFRYYSLIDGEGIDGANVGVNISNPDLYNIENLPGGYYDIEFDTSFIDNLGIFQLNFNFSAPSFEPQTHIYQFEIVEQSVNIIAYVDNVEIQRNSIIDITYMEEINISAQARALIDDNLLTGGNFTWKISTYEETLNEYSNFWYNTSIQINPSIYSPGLNLIGIQFEMEKYQTEIFYFQLLVYEQPVDLSVFINSQPILENDIYEIMYMESISISVKAFAIIEADYINGALITWQGGSQRKILIESGSDWYNATIQIVPSNYTPGLNSIAIEFIKDNFQNKIFYFQLLVEVQSVNLSLYVDSNQISEDQLVEVMFKQNITISASAYGEIDLNYIEEAYISWNSESYAKNFIEYGANWYNLSLTFSATNFSSGINTVSIKFEKQNYATIYFSFQLLIREQSVQLNVSINSQSILENALVEVMFKESITIASQAFAMGEGIFLSGGKITLIGEMFTFDINENVSYPTWFSSNIIIDGVYFDLGINTVSVKFEQDNYTEAYFSFQFFVTAETVDLLLYIDSQEIVSNSLIELTYYDEFSLSIRALANVEKIFLDGGSVTFVIGSYNQDFIQNANYWYNTSVICDPSNFDLGINSVYVRYLHPNYTSSTFYFQILVNQIEMNVNTIDFQDSIESNSGESLVIRINLTEFISANYIENATISYSWEFGLGSFVEVGEGIYEIELKIPDNVHGTFKVSLIISMENILYKTTQFSFLLVIGEPQFPIFLIWIIIIVSALIISVLGILSLRSYVILPRKRRKEAELLSRTQRFKDMKNVQAIVISHRLSGIPLYTKSYSLLEKQKKELFSGFIQAITAIGEEIAGKRITSDAENVKKTAGGMERLIELDFKYFYCLICDREEIRIVLVLQDRASEQLKEVITNLATSIVLTHSHILENWDGSIEIFDKEMPFIIDQYFNFFYKEGFILNNPQYIATMRTELSKMETRILNTIFSIAKNKSEFFLEDVVQTVHEINKDLIIDSIETLLDKKIIISNIN